MAPCWGRRFLFRLLIALLLLGTIHTARADSPSGRDLLAGDFVRGITAQYPSVGGRWNLLRLSLANPFDRPADLLVAVYFDVDPTLQYARRVKVPPQIGTVVWLPILVPAAEHVVDRGFQYHVLVRSLGDSTGLIRDESGSLQLDRSLQIETEEQVTGIFHTFPPHEYLDTEPVERTAVDGLDLMRTGRFSLGIRQNWVNLFPGFAQAGEPVMEVFDQLVIADDKLLDDDSGLVEIRRWVNRGGKLWVMLDRVDPEILERILGDRFHGQLVERVELTQVQLVSSKGDLFPVREFDQPVSMARLLIDGTDVAYTVDDWPAAFWIHCGEGQVLVTTLGANAWVRPRIYAGDRNQRDPPTPAGEGWETDHVPLPPFDDLSIRLYSINEENVSSLPVLSKQVDEYVGYEIPDQGSIVGVLLGYSLLALIGAVCLHRMDRLSLFGVVGPALAIAFGGVLFTMRPASQDVPPTVVNLQLAKAVEGSDDLLVEGMMGLSTNDTSTILLGGDSGGWIMPEFLKSDDSIRFFTQKDQNSWEWDDLVMNPGSRKATFRQSDSAGRISAIATLDEDGLVGELTLPAGIFPEDAMLTTLSGRVGVELNQDRSFAARTSGVMSGNQFLAVNLMNDEQKRRSLILSELLNQPSNLWNTDRPCLMFWGKPWEIGFRFPEGFQQQGMSLTAVPVELQRPPEGRLMSIPAPLLPFREITGPDRSPPGGFYDYRKREWVKKNYESKSWFAFQIPPSLLPVEPHSAQIEIAVTGPVGKMDLAGWNGDSRVEFRHWSNPVNTLSIEVNDLPSGALSESGQFLLFVSGGVPREEQKLEPDTLPSPWQIESLKVTLKAVSGPVPGSP